MQNRIAIDGDYSIVQPDKCDVVISTTSTSDSDRNMVLTMRNKPIGSVWGYDLGWEGIPITEAARILQYVMERQFTMYCLDPFSANWRTTDFYASDFSFGARTFKDGKEVWESLSFNVRSIYRHDKRK